MWASYGHTGLILTYIGFHPTEELDISSIDCILIWRLYKVIASYLTAYLEVGPFSSLITYIKMVIEWKE